jgi:hypothetical protein
LAGPWFQLTQPNQPARPSATTLGTPVRGRLSSRRRLWRNNASSSAGSLRWCPSSPSGSRMRRPSAAVYRSRSLDLVAMIGTQREGEQGGTPSRQRVRRLTVSAGYPYRDRWLSPATHGPARLTEACDDENRGGKPRRKHASPPRRSGRRRRSVDRRPTLAGRRPRASLGRPCQHGRPLRQTRASIRPWPAKGLSPGRSHRRSSIPAPRRPGV